MPRETKVGSGGFVRYIDHFGSDESLVRTARVSTGRGFVSWHPYKRCKECSSTFLLENGNPIGHVYDPGCNHPDFEHFPKGDQGILNYMMANKHTSPIEFAGITFHFRVPMDIWRQIIRHRTANVSEYSTRYSEAIDEMATTKPDEWRKQADSNRQGSAGFIPRGTSDGDREGLYLTTREHELQAFAREIYEERLELGVAREQARKDLPLSNYTEAFWLMDMHNLFHFLSLRLDKHAQLEARQFGQGIATVAQELFPRIYSAFEEYKLYAVLFSRTEMKMLKELCSRIQNTFTQPLRDDPETVVSMFSKRELKEFLNKIGVGDEFSNLSRISQAPA